MLVGGVRCAAQRVQVLRETGSTRGKCGKVMNTIQKLFLCVGFFFTSGLLEARNAEIFIEQLNTSCFEAQAPIDAEAVVLDLNSLKVQGDTDEEREASLEKSRRQIRAITFPVVAKYRFFIIDFTSISQFTRSSDVVDLFEGCAKKQYQVEESTVVCLLDPRNAQHNRLLETVAQGLQASSVFDNRGSCLAVTATSSAINHFLVSRKKHITSYRAWLEKKRATGFIGKPYVEEDELHLVPPAYASPATKRSIPDEVESLAHGPVATALAGGWGFGDGLNMLCVAVQHKLGDTPVEDGGGSIPLTLPSPSAPHVRNDLRGDKTPGASILARRDGGITSPQQLESPMTQKAAARKHLQTLSEWFEKNKVPFVAYYCSSRSTHPEELKRSEEVSPLQIVYLSSEAFKNRKCAGEFMKIIVPEPLRSKTIIFICGYEGITESLRRIEKVHLGKTYNAYVSALPYGGGELLSKDESDRMRTYISAGKPSLDAGPAAVGDESCPGVVVAPKIEPLSAPHRVAGIRFESGGGAGGSSDGVVDSHSLKRARGQIKVEVLPTREARVLALAGSVVDLASDEENDGDETELDDDPARLTRESSGPSKRRKNPEVEVKLESVAVEVCASPVVDPAVVVEESIADVCEQYGIPFFKVEDALQLAAIPSGCKKVLWIPMSKYCINALTGRLKLADELAAGFLDDAFKVQLQFRINECRIIMFNDFGRLLNANEIALFTRMGVSLNGKAKIIFNIMNASEAGAIDFLVKGIHELAGV